MCISKAMKINKDTVVNWLDSGVSNLLPAFPVLLPWTGLEMYICVTRTQLG